VFSDLELKVSKAIWKTIPIFIPYGKNPVFADEVLVELFQ